MSKYIIRINVYQVLTMLLSLCRWFTYIFDGEQDPPNVSIPLLEKAFSFHWRSSPASFHVIGWACHSGILHISVISPSALFPIPAPIPHPASLPQGHTHIPSEGYGFTLNNVNLNNSTEGHRRLKLNILMLGVYRVVSGPSC